MRTEFDLAALRRVAEAMIDRRNLGSLKHAMNGAVARMAFERVVTPQVVLELIKMAEVGRG